MGKLIFFRCKDEGEKHMPSIFDVANYFISRTQIEEESSVTPLKLQKLCYYAQAWSLVWDDKKIFDDEFQAWAHGPANYDLFKKYEYRGYKPINKIDDDYDQSVFNEDEINTLDAVWDAYGVYDGKYLEQLTHSEKPWKDAREGCRIGERCNNSILTTSMKEYYSTL